MNDTTQHKVQLYMFPEHILSIKLVLFVLDGSELSIREFDRATALMEWSAYDMSSLEGFERVSIEQFLTAVELYASPESVKAFEAEYARKFSSKTTVTEM